MSVVNWRAFTVTGRDGEPDAIAALSMFMYFAADVHAIAGRLADGVEIYVGALPQGALTWYATASGAWKAWSPRILQRDLKLLRAYPAEEDELEIDYDSNPMPGPYGLALHGSDLKAKFEANGVNALRVDLPVTAAGVEGQEATLSLFKALIRACQPQSVNIGLAFKRTSGTHDDATKGVNALLMRYVGFDPCYRDARDSLSGRIFTAHWINYIDGELCHALGGANQIRSKLAGCDVESLADGLWIRSAERPGIGDVNRGATDLGWMPEVARVLKPIRAEFHAFGRPDFDASRWMRRLDDLPVGPWNNGVDDATV